MSQCVVLVLGGLFIHFDFIFLSGVLLLTNLANRFRIHKLSKVDQFVMSYGGK